MSVGVGNPNACRLRQGLLSLARATLSEAPPLTVKDPPKNRQSVCVSSDFDHAVVQLHTDLCRILDIDPPTNGNGLGNVSAIAKWLGKAPQQAKQIKAIVLRRFRQKLSSNPEFMPSTWRYFDDAVREALQAHACRRELEEFDPVIDRQAAQDRAHLRLWHEKRKWQRALWGPPPGEPGCRIPVSLIREFEERYGGGGEISQPNPPSTAW